MLIFGAVHYGPEKISKTDFQMQDLTIYHLIVIGELNGGFLAGGAGGGAVAALRAAEEVERISLHNQIC